MTAVKTSVSLIQKLLILNSHDTVHQRILRVYVRAGLLAQWQVTQKHGRGHANHDACTRHLQRMSTF